jgi:hypothetical protein
MFLLVTELIEMTLSEKGIMHYSILPLLQYNLNPTNCNINFTTGGQAYWHYSPVVAVAIWTGYAIGFPRQIF